LAEGEPPGSRRRGFGVLPTAVRRSAKAAHRCGSGGRYRQGRSPPTPCERTQAPTPDSDLLPRLTQFEGELDFSVVVRQGILENQAPPLHKNGPKVAEWRPGGGRQGTGLQLGSTTPPVAEGLGRRKTPPRRAAAPRNYLSGTTWVDGAELRDRIPADVTTLFAANYEACACGDAKCDGRLRSNRPAGSPIAELADAIDAGDSRRGARNGRRQDYSSPRTHGACGPLNATKLEGSRVTTSRPNALRGGEKGRFSPHALRWRVRGILEGTDSYVDDWRQCFVSCRKTRALHSSVNWPAHRCAS